MAGGFEFTFEDAFAFANKMQQAPRVVQSELIVATDRLTIAGMGKAIPLTPVRTGHLRRSHAYKPAIWTGAGVTGSYGNPVPYGPFVEQGTRFMAAQPFMAPSADFVATLLEREYGAAMKRVMARIGVG